MPSSASPTPNPSHQPPVSEAAGRSSALRLFVAQLSANRLRGGLILGLCLLSIAAVTATWIVLTSQASANDPATLKLALDAFDHGDYDAARRMAQAMQASDTLSAEQLGGPVFVLGAVAAREADSGWSRTKRGDYLLAARYLEEARDRGFPAGRKAQGLYLLGRSLYHSGQAAASRHPLLESLAADGRRATDIHRLLAAAYLNDPHPQYDKALEHNTRVLADPGLSSQQRYAGLLEQAHILFELDRPADCLATLDEIPPTAANRAEATVLRGRLMMRRAREITRREEVSADEQVQAQNDYRAAIKTLLAAEGQDTLSTRATGKSMYLIGVCYLELGDYPAALAQFTRTAELYSEVPEKLAATLRQAELLRQMGRDQDALAAYFRVLDAAAEPGGFHNPWVSLDELQRRILDAYDHYLETRNFAVVLPLARRLEPLLGRVRTLGLRAEAHQAYGRQCLKQAALEPPQAEELRRRGRAELRRAGWALLELAKQQVATRDYPRHLWSAAEAYLAGQDYPQAIAVLKEYLRNEPRRRRAEALVRLGRALLAVERLNEAEAALSECVELHPRDPATFEARLLAAQVCVEQGQPESAVELLEANLRGERLTPASQEWRDSLFALGEVLHAEGRFDDAVRRLEEAAARYADDSRTLRARYLTADAYRRSAEQLCSQLREPQAGAEQGVFSQPIQDRYQHALATYAEIRNVLARHQETRKLSPREAAVLRNCYFAAGGVLFTLGQFEAAIQQYSAAANRYQNAPEALEAYVQIARAYRRLDRPNEARSALEQAKVVLDRLEPTVQFAATTNYTRQQWAERLDWLSQL